MSVTAVCNHCNGILDPGLELACENCNTQVCGECYNAYELAGHGCPEPHPVPHPNTRQECGHCSNWFDVDLVENIRCSSCGVRMCPLCISTYNAWGEVCPRQSRDWVLERGRATAQAAMTSRLEKLRNPVENSTMEGMPLTRKRAMLLWNWARDRQVYDFEEFLSLMVEFAKLEEPYVGEDS